MIIRNIILTFVGVVFFTANVFACTSIAWKTKLGIFTVRTNDWVESTNPVLVGIKSGTMRSMQGGDLGELYKVKYDMVAILAYGEFVHDGVNSQGLQVNSLYDKLMTMKKVTSSDQITQFTFGEYLLANYATVDEVIKALPTLKYGSLMLDNMPMEIKIHWSITDKTGDRAVIELEENGPKVYRGEDAMVMTNQPSLATHLKNKKAVEQTWVNSNRDTNYGSIGNLNAESRYIHASYFLSKLVEPTSVVNGLLKLSTVPFRVPIDAPNEASDSGVKGYGTEWTLTQHLNSGESVFEYNNGDNWSMVKFNIYKLMGKEFHVPLAVNRIIELQPKQ